MPVPAETRPKSRTNGRLSSDRQELAALLAQLSGAGVRTVVLRPSGARRLARLVASLALADLVGEAAR